jgi:hypothetical protein
LLNATNLCMAKTIIAPALCRIQLAPSDQMRDVPPLISTEKYVQHSIQPADQDRDLAVCVSRAHQPLAPSKQSQPIQAFETMLGSNRLFPLVQELFWLLRFLLSSRVSRQRKRWGFSVLLSHVPPLTLMYVHAAVEHLSWPSAMVREENEQV